MADNNSTNSLSDWYLSMTSTVMVWTQGLTRYVFDFVFRITLIGTLIGVLKNTQQPGLINILHVLAGLCVLSAIFQAGEWIFVIMDKVNNRLIPSVKASTQMG